MNLATKAWRTVKALPALMGAAWKSASQTYTAATAHLSDWWQGLTSLWASPGYAKLAKKAHANAHAGRGLRLIAQTMASVPLTVREGGSEDEAPQGSSDHPLIGLLQRPNPRQTKRHLFDEIVNHLYLGGELFVEQRSPETGRRAGVPQRLYLHRPDRFHEFIRLGRSGMPQGFEERLNEETRRLVAEGDVIGYKVEGRLDRGRLRTFTIDEMHHIRVYNPAKPERGLALMAACASALQGMEASSEWNLTLAKNAGRVPGWLSPKGLEKGEQLTPEQVKRAQENMDERVKRQRSSNLPMVLSGAFDYEGGAVTPEEAHGLDLDKWNAKKVSAVLGVSARLLGDDQQGSLTDAGIDSELKALYLLTVLPILDFVLEELNAWLTPKFDEDLELSYDRDQIEALQEDMTEKYRRYREGCGVPFLTPDEAREALGYEPEGGVADQRYVPVGMEAAGEGEEAPSEREPPPLRSLREMEDGQFDDVLEDLGVAA